MINFARRHQDWLVAGAIGILIGYFFASLLVNLGISTPPPMADAIGTDLIILFLACFLHFLRGRLRLFPRMVRALDLGFAVLAGFSIGFSLILLGTWPGLAASLLGGVLVAIGHSRKNKKVLMAGLLTAIISVASLYLLP